VDRAELQSSADKHRSMQDLKSGFERINADFMLANAVVGITDKAWESHASVRHVNRGVATTFLLLEDSVPGFHDNSAESFYADINLDGPSLDKQQRQKQFQRTFKELEEARRQVTQGDTWDLSAAEQTYNENSLRTQIDKVLNEVQLLESVETAVKNLDGQELEEATDLDVAKYGAAGFVLRLAAQRV
jgi:hypothetical protein